MQNLMLFLTCGVSDKEYPSLASHNASVDITTTAHCNVIPTNDGTPVPSLHLTHSILSQDNDILDTNIDSNIARTLSIIEDENTLVSNVNPPHLIGHSSTYPNCSMETKSTELDSSKVVSDVSERPCDGDISNNVNTSPQDSTVSNKHKLTIDLVNCREERVGGLIQSSDGNVSDVAGSIAKCDNILTTRNVCEKSLAVVTSGDVDNIDGLLVSETIIDSTTEMSAAATAVAETINLTTGIAAPSETIDSLTGIAAAAGKSVDSTTGITTASVATTHVSSSGSSSIEVISPPGDLEEYTPSSGVTTSPSVEVRALFAS